MDGDLEIPLYLESVNVDDELELSWTIPENLPTDWSIYLTDNFTNEVISVLENSKYIFLNESIAGKINNTVPSIELRKVQLKTQEENHERFKLVIKSDKIANSISTEEEFPSSFNLAQNYPNPFNPTTTISYTLKSNDFVRLSIYSITGQEVASLVNSSETAGEKQVVWNAGNLSSGIYYARLQLAGEAKTIKMTLLK